MSQSTAKSPSEGAAAATSMVTVMRMMDEDKDLSFE
jgi:hypothetical protein